MPLYSADGKIELCHNAQKAFAIGEKLTVTFHGRKATVKRLARAFTDRELAFELDWRQRYAGCLERREYGFTRWQQRRIDVSASRAPRCTRSQRFIRHLICHLTWRTTRRHLRFFSASAAS